MQQHRQSVLISLELWKDKWRSPPSAKYLSAIADILVEYEIADIRKLLDESVDEFDIVPSLSQIKKLTTMLGLIKKDKKYSLPQQATPWICDDNGNTPKTIEPTWVSTLCPGMPASIEALMIRIEQGTTEMPGFSAGLEYCGLNADEAWTIFESWKEGKVHPIIFEKKEFRFRF